MDAGHCVKWYDLTGYKQYEWFDCWGRLGHPFLRVENETHGLCDTNLNCITDVAGVQKAMITSPTLAHCHPANHGITDAT